MIKRVDKRLQAVQCLTGNKIKIIACITMLIDHFSKIFLESIMNDKLFPLYLAGGMSTEQFYGIDAFQKNILNGIGTIAFPLFCLLLSEGFFYGRGHAPPPCGLRAGGNGAEPGPLNEGINETSVKAARI